MARKPVKATETKSDPKPKKASLDLSAPAKKSAKPPAKAAAPAKPAKAPAPKTPKPASEGTAGVVDRSRYDYTITKDVKTASGRASVDNADPIASALRGKSADDVIKLVKDNGGEANPKWDGLNPGLARMAAGNALRKLAKRSEGVKIDGKRVAIAA